MPIERYWDCKAAIGRLWKVEREGTYRSRGGRRRRMQVVEKKVLKRYLLTHKIQKKIIETKSSQRGVGGGGGKGRIETEISLLLA